MYSILKSYFFILISYRPREITFIISPFLIFLSIHNSYFRYLLSPFFLCKEALFLSPLYLLPIFGYGYYQNDQIFSTLLSIFILDYVFLYLTKILIHLLKIIALDTGTCLPNYINFLHVFIIFKLFLSCFTYNSIESHVKLSIKLNNNHLENTFFKKLCLGILLSFIESH